MMKSIGKWNERGQLNSLFKKGFKGSQALGELVGNSIDAGAKNIYLMKDEDVFSILDDGKGMNQQQLEDMFEVYRENHQNDYTTGTCGLGSKAALVIITNKTGIVYVYTRVQNGEYLKVIFPIGDIFLDWQLTGKIIQTQMSEQEIARFNHARTSLGLELQGTTIEMPNNEQIELLMETNFNDKWTGSNFSERLGVIYSKFPANIFYKNQEHIVSLKKFDYFHGENKEFYKRMIFPIKVYQEKNNDTKFRFLLEKDAEFLEFKPYGKGYQTKPSKIKLEEMHQFKHIGNYKLTLGQRIDPNYFDPRHPSMPNSASSELRSFDSKYFDSKSDYFKYLCKPVCVRNNQVIGEFGIETASSSSSARGNATSMHKIYHVRSELSYQTLSSQTNLLDDITKIQENKNQWNPEFPVQLIRLIIFAKEYVHGQIWSYFAETCRNKTKPQIQLSVSETESDDDSEDGSEDGSEDDSKDGSGGKDGGIIDASRIMNTHTSPNTEPVEQIVSDIRMEPMEKTVQLQEQKVMNRMDRMDRMEDWVQDKQVDAEPLNEGKQEEEVKYIRPYYLVSEIQQSLYQLDKEQLMKVVKVLIKPGNVENFQAMFDEIPEKILIEMIRQGLKDKLPEDRIIQRKTLGVIQKTLFQKVVNFMF